MIDADFACCAAAALALATFVLGLAIGNWQRVERKPRAPVYVRPRLKREVQ